MPSRTQLTGSSTNTLLLTAPPYVFAGVWYWFETWYSDRRNTIYPVILVCIATASMTYIISLATTNFGARYFALMLMPCGSGTFARLSSESACS